MNTWVIDLYDWNGDKYKTFVFDMSYELEEAVKDISQYIGGFVPGTDRMLHHIETRCYPYGYVEE